MTRSLVAGLTLACCLIALASASACNKRVFEKVENTCDRTIRSDIDVPTEKSADILIVVDNSGSMQEEQTNLANNFFNEDIGNGAGQCPLNDLANIPDEYKNPPRATYTAGGALSSCGFIQLLAAFENDFRVGVITTDVGICDNRLPAALTQAFCTTGAGAGRPECSGPDADNRWGFRPQRGCLQPDGPPFGADLHKLIQRSDLDDPALDDLAARFKSTLDNIRTFGSPFERGLDAATLFLTAGGSSRAPGCENDLTSFRRDDAQLVVIFLTDEEDCSHGGDGLPSQAGTFNENEGEVCGENQSFFTNNARACYDGEADLPSVASYANTLKGVEEGVKVAIVAGGLGEPGSVEPEGCRTGGDGTPNGDCVSSGGLSNATNGSQGQLCSNTPLNPTNDANIASIISARGCDGTSCDLPCCQADAGDRYFGLAGEFEGKALTDSICNASFRETMLDIAAFIAAVDFVELAEAPESPNAISVAIERADSGETQTIAPLADAAACATETGWILEGERRIVLCGDARPGPGDKVKVSARGTNDTAACQ